MVGLPFCVKTENETFCPHHEHFHLSPNAELLKGDLNWQKVPLCLKEKKMCVAWTFLESKQRPVFVSVFWHNKQQMAGLVFQKVQQG